MASEIIEQCQAVIESGNMTEILEQCPIVQGFTGGMVGGALIALGIFFVAIILAGFYVYHALAWYTVSKKLKESFMKKTAIC